jgi:hypothetical protein
MLSEQEISQVFIEELTAQATILQKKANEKQVFVVDIDKLIASDSPSGGDTYQEFLGGTSKPITTGMPCWLLPLPLCPIIQRWYARFWLALQFQKWNPGHLKNT